VQSKERCGEGLGPCVCRAVRENVRAVGGHGKHRMKQLGSKGALEHWGQLSSQESGSWDG
jgi:hypothetical protein